MCQLWTFGEEITRERTSMSQKSDVSVVGLLEKLLEKELSYVWDSKYPLEDTINHYGLHLLHILTNVKVKKKRDCGVNHMLGVIMQTFKKSYYGLSKNLKLAISIVHPYMY